MKTYKCGYNYCKNEGVVNEDVAIMVKNRYYCPECEKEMSGKEKIRELYKRDIDTTPNSQQLNMAIKKIVNEYGCDIDFVIYSFKYIKENNIKINNPFGLTWVVKDGKLISKYKKEVITRKANEIRMSVEITPNDDSGEGFEYKKSTPKWLREI